MLSNNHMQFVFTSKQALEAIKYIDQIVTTSSANARAVQQCGLDMYVLDLLKKAKDGPAEITEGLLAIFYKIALVVSHVNAAQRYISLLAPIKGRYIPKHQGLYLKYMNKILADSLKNPTGYLQIQDNRSAIDIYGITGDMVSAGFSFCFWVFIDPANASYKPAILTMTDSQNRKLVWFISSQNLYLTQRTTNFESTGRVEVILPALQWTLVTVSYNSTQTEATVRTFINNEEKKRLEFIPMNFSNGNLTVRIGGLESESTTITKQFTRIAAFGMFNTLHFDQVSQIYATGPQLHGVFPIKPMFAYKLVGSSDDSTLSKKYALPDIEFSMADLARSPQTFSTSLLVYCKIEMLLPLLAQFDMTFEDGTPMSDIKMLVFEVLGHALIGNEDAQADFHQSEGFSVVAHLLMSINASNINYQLYMQFFALLQRINGSDLIHDIIKYVMINVEILMRADAEEHLKIIRHWARVLVPSYRRFVSKCLSFRRCLSILRLYYYYTPCESPQIMGLNRPKDLQVKDCRLSLFTAAMDAASNQFTIDDFMLIIGHCLTIIEDQQVYELLEFLTNIVNKIPQQFQPLAAQIDMGSFLMSVLSRKNEKYLIAIIKFLVACLSNKITSSNILFQEVMYVMHQMSPSHATLELYDFLFDLVTKGIVELLPLITWVSMSLPGKTIELFENLEPSPNFVQHNAWSMWPVIAAFKMSDARHTILDFLSRCATLQWPPIFAMIDMVGRLIEEKSEDMKADFLMSVAQTLTSTSKIQSAEIRQFFKVVKFFLFYRPLCAKNEAISSLLQKAPEGFVTDTSEDDLLNEKNEIIDEVPIPALIIEKMINLKSYDQGYSFGIRLDKEGKWVDYIFASFCMSLFARFDPRTLIDVYFLMCSFLLHHTPDIVIQQTSTLELSESEKNSNQIFLSFVNHHSKITIGKPIFDLSLSESEQEENAFLCLQRQHYLMDERMNLLIGQLDQFIRDFGTEINEGLIRCFSTTLDDAINTSLTDVEHSIDRNHEILAEGNSKWILLWRTVSGDYGPWECTTSGHKEIHFKRDNTACINFVPIKLKRNWGYDDHKQASVARDTGSKVTAEEKIAEDVARRAEMYQQNGLIKLFEILDKPNVQSPKKGDVESKTLSGVHQLPCKVIQLKSEREGKFTLTRRFTKIEFKDGKVKFIKHNDLQHIMFRRRFHRPNSMEIFTVDGRSYFIHFTEHLSLPIISKYSTVYTPNLVTLQTRDFGMTMRTSKQTELWTTGRISNFEYLMHLNIMSGRSFNDLTQYPVVPWVVSNYSTPYMYLNSADFFRDLTKPIGAVGEERLNDILSRIPDLKHLGEEPYLYGSGYSCALTVCLYLIRLEPFTTLHIDLQSGRFDHASRIFASIEAAWEMVNKHLSDYRELIPEFFFMPEFLMNMNGFDLGTIRGSDVDNVELPAWSSNAYEFVYLHRKALESEIVSQNLHKWIDLIWGVDSRGANAEEHHNVFKQEMYDDIWTEKNINNPVRRAEIEATLCHVGQIPPQLFKVPHPQRHTIKAGTVLGSPCIVKSFDFKNAVIARIDRGKDAFHYQASMCNAKGEYQSYIVDLSICTNKNSLAMNRASSNHDLLKEPKSIKRSNSSESGLVAEVYEIPVNKINRHSKQIKEFDGLGIKGMPKPSTVADIQLGRFAIVGARTRKAMVVNFRTGAVEPIANVGGDAVAVCSSGSQFGVATTNAIFKVGSGTISQQGIGLDLSESVSIPSYRDSVSCCAISTQFHLSVLGTRDGFLTVSSLTTGETVRVIDLGCRPQMILITPSWGFIVVYMTRLEGGRVTHRLTVFNVNGEELRTTVLRCGITAWHSWSSHAGFDFLVMGDERGRIFSFEVFYLFPGEAVYKAGSPVVCIKHFRTISVTAVVTVDGNLIFIPHSPTDAQLY